ILYTELGPSGPPSDFLHINQYQVIIQSDVNEGGLDRRTAVPAVAIPASANEVFLPVSIFAGSDGNQGTTTTESDHVTIYTGFYGQPNPVPVFERTIVEPLPEGIPEPIIEFSTGPLFFDLLEPDGSGKVSDYVDLPNGITGYFLSSDNPADFSSQPI